MGSWLCSPPLAPQPPRTSESAPKEAPNSEWGFAGHSGMTGGEEGPLAPRVCLQVCVCVCVCTCTCACACVCVRQAPGWGCWWAHCWWMLGDSQISMERCWYRHLWSPGSAYGGLDDWFKELRVCGSSNCKKAHKLQGTKMHPSVYFP